jgi:hypothetical protein
LQHDFLFGFIVAIGSRLESGSKALESSENPSATALVLRDNKACEDYAIHHFSLGEDIRFRFSKPYFANASKAGYHAGMTVEFSDHQKISA